MPIGDVAEGLEQLERLLLAYPFAAGQLRPPAATEAIDHTAGHIGVDVPATMRRLYGWHDGAVPEPGGWELFLFPPYWQFLPLAWVEREARWPIAWCRAAGVEGFPFAKDPSGQFLVAQLGVDDAVLQVSSDFVMEAWAGGTLLGIVTETCRALEDQHVEYVAQFSDDRMEWIFPDRESADE